MAESKKLVRTVGSTDKFHVGDLTITRDGVELTAKQAEDVQEAAKASRVQLDVSDAKAASSGGAAGTGGAAANTEGN